MVGYVLAAGIPVLLIGLFVYGYLANFEMNAKEGRRLAVLEIDTIFNNLLTEREYRYGIVFIFTVLGDHYDLNQDSGFIYP